MRHSCARPCWRKSSCLRMRGATQSHSKSMPASMDACQVVSGPTGHKASVLLLTKQPAWSKRIRRMRLVALMATGFVLTDARTEAIRLMRWPI